MPETKREATLIDLVERLAASRRVIARNHLLIAVGALVLSLVIPKSFEAKTTIFPAAEDKGSGLDRVFSSSAARQLLSSITLDGSATPSTLLIGMVKSRAVGLAVIDSLDLVSHYKKRDSERAYLVFQKRLATRETPEGFIEIAVEDRSPEMAARIANLCVDELKRLSVEHDRSQAHKARVFIESRFDSTRIAFHAALDSLRGYQEATGMLEPTEQTKALIVLAEKLLAERNKAQIGLTAARAYATEENPAVRELAGRLAAIDAQVDRLRASDESGVRGFAFDSMEDVPAEAMAYAQLLLTVKAQEEAYLLLAAKYEEARIGEARDVAKIEVLDPAVPPIKKSRPKRSLVILAILFGSVVAHVTYYASVLAIAASPDGARWSQVGKVLRISRR